MPLVYDKNSLSKLGFNLSKKKLLLLGFLFVLILVIPLTVYLVQQQQQTQSHANPNTTLSFTPNPATVSQGGKAKFDIILSPGNNEVNFVKLVIKFDPTKLNATSDSFQLDPASNLAVLQAATVNNDSLSVTLNIGSDPTKVIKSNTKIGTVTFDVISDIEGQTAVSFDSNPDTGVQIRSLNGSNNDGVSENVFLNGVPAQVTIQGASTDVSGSPTPAISEAVSGTPSVSPSEDVSAAPSESPDTSITPSSNQAPVCESLAVDQTVGTAPFDVNFTVTGNDTDGTINKITFNYGDGPVEDVTSGDTLGTASVSLEQAHTYENSGSFTATALLTDDAGGVSDTTTCTQTITVSSGGDASESATITPLAATGPSNTIVGIGALGGVLFLIGALLFLAL